MPRISVIGRGPNDLAFDPCDRSCGRVAKFGADGAGCSAPDRDRPGEPDPAVLTGLFALWVPPTPGGSSFMENLSTQVQERWANPQWLVSLHTLHPTTLRREIAMEKSLKEEIRYLRMVSKQHREALLAMIAGKGRTKIWVGMRFMGSPANVEN